MGLRGKGRMEIPPIPSGESAEPGVKAPKAFHVTIKGHPMDFKFWAKTMESIFLDR